MGRLHIYRGPIARPELPDAVVVRYRVPATTVDAPGDVRLQVGQRLQLIREDDSIRMMGPETEPLARDAGIPDADVFNATRAGQTTISIIPRSYDSEFTFKLKATVQR